LLASGLHLLHLPPDGILKRAQFPASSRPSALYRRLGPRARGAARCGPSMTVSSVRQCALDIANLPPAKAENLASHAVQIEPGLRPRSPENGNISNIRRRLSAISLPPRPVSEPGD
jgi:hypothetical protein